MTAVTFQVLEGLERGRVFEALPLPVTIGREEENTVRLNDERISRFHIKLQEDRGRVILTDLDSTNGTRVNGRTVSMRVLRAGDQVAVGRCLLLYGSRDEITAQAAQKSTYLPPDEGSVFDDQPGEGSGSFQLSGVLDEPLPELPEQLARCNGPSSRTCSTSFTTRSAACS